MTKAGSAKSADRSVPMVTATKENEAPMKAWTALRKTSAIPATTTLEGAIKPGATGIKHGPLGSHTKPTLTITQLLAGTVNMKSLTSSTY